MIGYGLRWLLMLFAGMPVAFTLLVSAMLWLILNQQSLISIPQRLIGGIDSFPLLAVPCFILAGLAMNAGGVSNRIYDFARALVGHFTGGLAHVNIVGSLIFSGMSGSAIADAGGLGTLEVKAMKEDGYSAEYAGALTCASCIIGPLIPPSIPMVLYGVIANASIGSLFLAGIVPGLLTALFLMIQVYFHAKKMNLPRHARATAQQFWGALKRSALALLTPFIIIGGIFGGIFTPTEAAAVAALYSLLLGLFVYRELKWGQLPQIFREAVNISAVVGFIVACASAFSWILAREQVPQQIAQVFLSFTNNPWVLLAIINVILLVLGCFMEGIAIMIIMVPVLLPAVKAVGVDPVHFGVIVVMNLMLGILTPPFGVALFTVAKVANIPFEKLARAVLPFLWPLLLVQAIITFFPALIMWPAWLAFGK